MGLIDRLGGLQKTRQKSKNSDKTLEQMVQEAIDVQMKIAKGETVLNDKKNPVKSWFRNGQMTPVVTNMKFFEENPSLDVGNESPVSILTEFDKEFKGGVYKDYISDLQRRVDKRNVELRKARGKAKPKS